MKMETDENEWELSKENVQPLRQGRRIATLNAGLKTQSTDQMCKIKEEKHAFEAELRIYAGDDPIEVWYRYILWAEQSFPKGGKDSNLTTILERCVKQFKDEEKYRNDERYIYAWMKMADICREPLDIYNFLYDQNIGCELSCFYEGWASVLEQLGNFKSADAVYQNGIRRNAKPLENLRHRHEDFQKRVARKIAQGVDTVDDAPEESESQHRQVLSQLRTMGSKKQVPISRTGDAIQGVAGVLAGVRPKIKNQVVSAAQILNDENIEQSFPPPQTGEWMSAPKQEILNKENEKKPGVWTKQKLSKPSVNVPISAVNTLVKASFTVHVDQDQGLAFNSRKEIKTSTSNYLQTITVAEDQNEKAMYCKDKIYCGAEEYSFEELKAERWMMKQEMVREEQRLLEMKKQLEWDRQLLLEEAEWIRQQRLELQQEEQRILARQQMELEKDRVKELPQQQESSEESLKSRLSEQVVHNVSTKGKQGSLRQLTFEDDHDGNKDSISHQALAPVKACQKKKPLQQQLVVIASQNLSNSRTPDSFMSSNPAHRLSESLDKTPNYAPSPTVCTKEALQLVMGLFNATLDLDKHRVSDDGHFEESVAPAPPSVEEPFVVYDESQEPNQASKPPATFTIFQDCDESSTMPSKPESMEKSCLQQTTQNNNVQINYERSSQTFSSGCQLFDDDNFEGFVFHPRNDVTLAPVGSRHSFAASAHLASTPFTTKIDALPRLDDDSDIEMEQDQEKETNADVIAGLQVQEQELQDQTEQASTSSSFKKTLSPIMEGSSEDSSANSKNSRLNLISGESRLLKHNLTPVIDQSEDASFLSNNSRHAVIDVPSYFPEAADEKLKQQMNVSIGVINPSDPYNFEDREKILNSLKKPLSCCHDYNSSSDYMPHIDKGDLVTLGMDAYEVLNKITEGQHATVFVATNTNIDFCTNVLDEDPISMVAIKVQTCAQRWEFYVCNELHQRLSKLCDPVDVRPAIMKIHSGNFFKNGSCLVTEYKPYGTLLDLVNSIKKNLMTANQKFVTSNVQIENISNIQEPVLMYMTIELLHLVENMHKCQIIHGNIKPENFLVLQMPPLPMSTDPLVVFGGRVRFVQLISFGQSIDMTKYPPGTTFYTNVDTECFQCIEMKTNRPWTYQTDLFGLAGTIHVLIFNQDMEVCQENGEWKMTANFLRCWKSDLWEKLFHVLLNVPNCSELPNFSKIRHEFEQYFVNNLLPQYNAQCATLTRTIVNSSKIKYLSYS